MVEMRQPVPVRRQAGNNETHLLLLKPEHRHSQDRNRTSRQRKGNDADSFVSPRHLWEGHLCVSWPSNQLNPHRSLCTNRKWDDELKGSDGYSSQWSFGQALPHTASSKS